MANEIRKDLFENVSVPKAVAKLALPTILAQIIGLIYNLADTLFIGMLGDPNMVAAVSLAVPMFMILVSVANLFGVGGSSVISRALGTGDVRRARTAGTLSIYGAAGTVTVLSLIALFVLQPVSLLFGASEATLDFTVEYLFWIFVIGGLPMVATNVISHIIRAEGNSVISATGTAVGGILNIALDPIFIFVLGWGVKGVAVATMLSNVASVLFFASYLIIKRQKTIVSVSPKSLKGSLKLILPLLSIGAPAAINSILVSVSVAFLNKAVADFGDVPLAAIGIVKKIDLIPWSVIFGLTHGIMPLVGYNFAAKNFKRMRAVIRFALYIAIGLNVVFLTVFELFAPQLVALFIGDAGVIEYGGKFLRIFCTCVPFMSVGFLFISTFQAMGKPIHSLFLSVCRQGLFFIPTLFLMRAVAGLYGLIWTQTIADAVFAVLGATLFLIFLRKSQQKLPLDATEKP